MKLIGICPRCGGQTAWDSYFDEARCIPCSYSGGGKLAEEQPTDAGYGKNEVYPDRIRFSIYHPVFEWSSVPVFEKWEFDAVVRFAPTSSKKPFLYILEAINAIPLGLWPDEIIDQRFQYARRVMDRIINEFREAIRMSIAKRLNCRQEDIKGIISMVDCAVQQSDIRGPQYAKDIENVG